VLCCAVQSGLVSLEQLLPYLGPSDELQKQYKAAYSKLQGDVAKLAQITFEEGGGWVWRLLILRGCTCGGVHCRQKLP